MKSKLEASTSAHGVQGRFIAYVTESLYTREVPMMFSEDAVRTIAENLGVDIDSETSTDLICYCPFHSNRHSPSFALSKDEGVFLCFNPECGKTGSMHRLVSELTEWNEFEIHRFIQEYSTPVNAADSIEKIIGKSKDEEGDTFDRVTLEGLQKNLAVYEPAQQYLAERGVSRETQEHFGLGYSSKRDMLAIPVWGNNDTLMGVVGRSISHKRYENSKGSQFSKTLFNIQNAKRHNHSLVIVEGAFDAMRIHDAGYPCVVATLGGHISKVQKQLIDGYFNRIIVFTDADAPGRELGKKLVKSLPGKIVLWAMHPDEPIYGGAKDAGEMDDDSINACITNAVSSLEYRKFEQDNPI